jgi:DNA invertase Pin-like site-specific DNA recombinase
MDTLGRDMTDGHLIGYARTSTTDQQAGLEAQLRDLKAAGCRKVFSEQASAVGERPQLEATLDYAREGDTVCVTKLDRLARSARHLSELVDRLESKGVTLRILNFGGDPVDTRGATGRLMLNMFAAMAQFEREMMLERQREGIAKAKADGKYKGRKPTARVKAEDAVQMFRAGKRVAHIAKDLGIGRGSVYRALEAAGLTAER